MKPHISVTTLGVRDLNRAKQFYGEGLGWPVRQAQGPWVCFGLGKTSALGLLPLEALAAVPACPPRAPASTAFATGGRRPAASL
jgi:predicted enzyme related to lactoylglutathione lyase